MWISQEKYRNMIDRLDTLEKSVDDLQENSVILEIEDHYSLYSLYSKPKHHKVCDILSKVLKHLNIKINTVEKSKYVTLESTLPQVTESPKTRGKK